MSKVFHAFFFLFGVFIALLLFVGLVVLAFIGYQSLTSVPVSI